MTVLQLHSGHVLGEVSGRQLPNVELLMNLD